MKLFAAVLQIKEAKIDVENSGHKCKKKDRKKKKNVPVMI